MTKEATLVDMEKYKQKVELKFQRSELLHYRFQRVQKVIARPVQTQPQLDSGNYGIAFQYLTQSRPPSQSRPASQSMLRFKSLPKNQSSLTSIINSTINKADH